MMLNVPSTVAAEMIVNVEDLAMTDTTEVTREEVEVAVRKLKNGKASGSDEIVAELVKNGGLVVGATRRSVKNKKSASRVEECHLDPTPQEAKQEGL